MGDENGTNSLLTRREKHRFLQFEKQAPLIKKAGPKAAELAFISLQKAMSQAFWQRQWKDRGDQSRAVTIKQVLNKELRKYRKRRHARI